MWATWAWAKTGQPCLGTIWVMCWLGGHGLELAPTSGSRMVYVSARWAWVRTGHPCLGTMRGMCGLCGHGLELVTHVWVPYGLCVG